MDETCRIDHGKSGPGEACGGIDALKISMICFVAWAGFQRVLELQVGAEASVLPDGLPGHRHLLAVGALTELALRDAELELCASERTLLPDICRPWFFSDKASLFM